MITKFCVSLEMHSSTETTLLFATECYSKFVITNTNYQEISKLYLMDKHRTSEIPHEVAQYLNFSYTELRSFLNMFYDEEEREADRIRTKYLVIRRRLQYVIRLKQGQGQMYEENTPDAVLST